MATRITQKDLEQLVRVINKTAGHDPEPYTGSGGTFTQNPDTYVLDYAYGGVALDQNSPLGADGKSHGVSRVAIGRGTKRELYNQLRAFHDGMLVKS